MHFLHEVRVSMPNRGEKYWSDYELSGNTRSEKSLCHQKGKRAIHLKFYIDGKPTHRRREECCGADDTAVLSEERRTWRAMSKL